MQAPTELHPALREAWEFAENVRGDVLDAVHPVTYAQWTFRPAAGAWCVGEVVDHLVRAEIGTSKMVRKLIRGDYAAQAVQTETTLHTRDLDRYPYGRLDAPRDLIPGMAREKTELERELNLVHRRFRSELEMFEGADPEALRSPDPATGDWFTLGGWLKLQAWHEAHHLAQIRSILASPGVPR